MPLKRLALMLLILAFSLCLTGCDFFTMETEQMLAPPALIGDMAPIQEALGASIKGEYTLKYPSSGEYRSAVVLNDINGDGTFEAFAFYSQTDGEVNYMHVNFILRKGKKWVSVADQKIVAGGVDCVDFADLNSDGLLEIIVGFEIYGSTEKQLNVFSLEKNVVTQRLIHEYTSFLCSDLDENGESELFVHLFKVAGSENTAYLYTLDKTGAVQLSSCAMDKAVRTVASPVLSELSNGVPAIYIDESKPSGNITEVLFISKGNLINPLLDSETGENTKTLRASDISIGDINGDKIIEIPVSELLAAFVDNTGEEKVYYTKWCSFNGESLTPQQTTLLNTNDGYYISVPEKWVGKITLIRETNGKSRTVYYYNGEEKSIGAALAFYTAIPLDDWKEYKEKNKDVFEISRNGVYVFAGKVYKGDGNLFITEQELKAMFFLY